MGVNVSELSGRRDFKDFIQVPYDLYESHPVWVPPLRLVTKRESNFSKNGFFKTSDAALSIAERGDLVKGNLRSIRGLLERRPKMAGCRRPIMRHP
jgi:hypothetical protein